MSEMHTPQLSIPVESISSMDILVALGRGSDDLIRAQLALDIAQEVAIKQRDLPRTAAFLGPLVVLCGNEPWHGPASRPESKGAQVEATGMLNHAYQLLDNGQYPDLNKSQLRTVGGDSTIASMVEVAQSTEVANNPEVSMAVLTDTLHDRYGRVGRSALAVFGTQRPLKVVTYPSPRGLKEQIMEAGMSLLTRRALRNVTPGDAAQALEAQARVEKSLRVPRYLLNRLHRERRS